MLSNIFYGVPDVYNEKSIINVSQDKMNETIDETITKIIKYKGYKKNNEEIKDKIRTNIIDEINNIYNFTDNNNNEINISYVNKNADSLKLHIPSYKAILIDHVYKSYLLQKCENINKNEMEDTIIKKFNELNIFLDFELQNSINHSGGKNKHVTDFLKHF